MRASKHTAWILAAPMAVACGAAVSAHRLDEFLQSARISVEPESVQLEMHLTPGMPVADRVVREIDADQNGDLSQEEQQVYARQVLSALTLCVDDSSPLHMELTASTFPDVAALRAGDGAIIIRSVASVSGLPVGAHRLAFHNANDVGNSVYLANALVPENDQIAVTGQLRDGSQRDLTLEFVLRETPASSGRWAWMGLAGALVLAAPVTRLVRRTLNS